MQQQNIDLNSVNQPHGIHLKSPRGLNYGPLDCEDPFATQIENLMPKSDVYGRPQEGYLADQQAPLKAREPLFSRQSNTLADKTQTVYVQPFTQKENIRDPEPYTK